MEEREENEERRHALRDWKNAKESEEKMRKDAKFPMLGVVRLKAKRRKMAEKVRNFLRGEELSQGWPERAKKGKMRAFFV